MLLNVHRNRKTLEDGKPRTATSTFTQLTELWKGQDGRLDFHTAPELWKAQDGRLDFHTAPELWKAQDGHLDFHTAH